MRHASGIGVDRELLVDADDGGRALRYALMAMLCVFGGLLLVYG